MSGQLSGHLQFYDLDNNYLDFKKYHIKNITNNFNENAYYLRSKTPDKNEWIYEILSAELKITNNDCLELKPVDTSKLKLRKESTKILNNPLKMKSSYSENLRNMINLGILLSNSKFLSENIEKLNTKHLELLKSLVQLKDLNNMDINGFEINISRIESNYTLSLNSTCEPSNTFFAKNIMTNVDYIFYNGCLEVLRTLNTPEIYDMLHMKGLPNINFPSDHISLSAEFLINI